MPRGKKLDLSRKGAPKWVLSMPGPAESGRLAHREQWEPYRSIREEADIYRDSKKI